MGLGSAPGGNGRNLWQEEENREVARFYVSVLFVLCCVLVSSNLDEGIFSQRSLPCQCLGTSDGIVPRTVSSTSRMTWWLLGKWGPK